MHLPVVGVHTYTISQETYRHHKQRNTQVQNTPRQRRALRCRACAQAHTDPHYRHGHHFEGNTHKHTDKNTRGHQDNVTRHTNTHSGHTQAHTRRDTHGDRRVTQRIKTHTDIIRHTQSSSKFTHTTNTHTCNRNSQMLSPNNTLFEGNIKN